jgi:hypothetical protein
MAAFSETKSISDICEISNESQDIASHCEVQISDSIIFIETESHLH